MTQIMTGILIIVLLTSISLNVAESACTLPSGLTGAWWDSSINGPITISGQRITTGWELTLNTKQFASYACIESDDTYWVFRSENTIPYTFGLEYYAVFCLEYTYITDNSYMYYIQTIEESSMNNRRVFLVDTPTEDTYTSISQYCSPPSNGGPDTREYNVLVKQNTQQQVHLQQYFPDSLLGVFSYSVDDGTSTFCGAGSVWDGCYVNGDLDRTTITLNQTLCSNNIMGSANGKFYNVANVTHETTNYVMLINADGTNTLFTCLAVSESGLDRSISTNPGGCAKGQISTSHTTTAGSLLITMTAYETCLFTTTTSTTTTTTTTTTTKPPTTTNNSTNTGGSTTDSGSSNTAAVVGAVMSLLLLLAILIIAFLIYQKYFKRRRPHVKNLSFKKEPTDIKRPLPNDSDFTLSDIGLRREPTMAEDLVVDSLSPRDTALPMDRVLSRQSAPNYL